jgi:hypothetical protein
MISDGPYCHAEFRSRLTQMLMRQYLRRIPQPPIPDAGLCKTGDPARDQLYHGLCIVTNLR